MSGGEHAFLVVGGDSLVGSGLVAALDRRGRPVFASTRRQEALTPRRIFLDFSSAETFCPPAGVKYAYLVAAATSYERCENDPLATMINVELIPGLVSSLLEQGLFITFISTNSVFGGERPWPQEDDPQAPRIAYARQKSQGERAIRKSAERLGALARLNIVRLTKILNASVSPLPAWFAAWKRGEPVRPFSDLVFAPMSVTFVAEALAKIGETPTPGNLHLSGANNVTYVDLAYALAQRLGVSTDLVEPTTAVAQGVDIPFKPRFSGLGMTRTTRQTGIEPQRLSHLVEDLVGDLGGSLDNER